MELGLANPDRGIGPDSIKLEVAGNFLGGSNLQIVEAIVLGVVDTEVPGPFIDLDSPNRGLRIAFCQGTSDRSVAGADIKNQLIGRNRCWTF